jgi:membrane-associated protease RseP (regulator of RpoE activity)
MVPIIVWAMFTILILLHELGHALTARALGLPCERIIVGIGPRWRWLSLRFRVAGIPISIRPLPFGGGAYVNEEGAALWKRALVVAAGPAVSVAVGVALLVAALGNPGWRMAVMMIERLPAAIAHTLWKVALLAPQPAAHAASTGAVPLQGALAMAGVLSVLLGVSNLLPFSPLDGGRLLGFSLVVLRVPVPVRVGVAYMGLGGVLLAMAPAVPGGWPGELVLVGASVGTGLVLRRVLPEPAIAWVAGQCGMPR